MIDEAESAAPVYQTSDVGGADYESGNPQIYQVSDGVKTDYERSDAPVHIVDYTPVDVNDPRNFSDHIGSHEPDPYYEHRNEIPVYTVNDSAPSAGNDGVGNDGIDSGSSGGGASSGGSGESESSGMSY
jgi:uncharacterized membrane protein YgcG